MIADIHKSILVPATPQRAFEIFWTDIGDWWPLHTHSLSGMNGKKARGLRFEPRMGGAITETMEDGSEVRWGVVTDWQPGKLMEFTWHLRHPEAEATRVRIAFAPSDAGTRVTLVHAGWEVQGASGGQNRDSYDRGWEAVFVTAFAQAAGRTA